MKSQSKETWLKSVKNHCKEVEEDLKKTELEHVEGFCEFYAELLKSGRKILKQKRAQHEKKQKGTESKKKP